MISSTRSERSVKDPRFWLFAITFIVLSGPSLVFLPSQSVAILVLAPVWLAFKRRHAPLAFGIASALVWALPLWMLASVSWTSNISQTLVEAGVFVALTSIAIRISYVLTFQQVSTYIVRSALLVLTVSLAVAVIRPELGLVSGTYQTGTLQGIYPHRNILAFTLLIGFAAEIGRADYKIRLKNSLVPLALVAGILLTSSSTALALLVLTIVTKSLLALLNLLRPAVRPAVLGVGLFFIGAAVTQVQDYFASVTESLGRDVTLTGRTNIWALAAGFIEREPMLGYGWGAVWGGDGIVGNAIVASLGFYIDHAHNGFLDIALQVGLVGLCLLSVLVMNVILSAIRGVLASEQSAPWILLMVTILTCYNLVETRMTRPLGWCVLILICLIQASYARTNSRTNNFKNSERIART